MLDKRPKIKRHNIYILPATHRRLVEIARRERRTIAAVVDILVAGYVPPFTVDSEMLKGDADDNRSGQSSEGDRAESAVPDAADGAA